MMDDLISRQAAIDVADAVWSVTGDKNVAKVWDQIKDLPSAQPVVISKSENATECEDAVSREAVLNEIHRYMEERDYTIGLLDDNVCGLPPVTPKQPGWIPCSKKLPELNRSVLVQLSDDFVDPIQIMTLNISKCEGDFFYFWETQEIGINFEMGDVVAWMPLPTPWKGGQEQNYESTI